MIYVGQVIQIPKQVSAPPTPIPTPTPAPAPTPTPTPTPSPTFVVSNRLYPTLQKNSWLGAPTSGEIDLGNGVIKQTFANGYIIWNGKKATAYQTGNRKSSQSPPSNQPTRKFFLGLKNIKPLYNNAKLPNKLLKYAQSIRHFTSPRGISKIASSLKSAIDAAGRSKWIGWIPFVRPVSSWMQKTAKPFLYGARRIFTKNPLGRVITWFAKSITKPSFVRSIAKFSKPFRFLGKWIPYVDLAVAALDVGLDLATAQTNEQKNRAQVKAIVGGIGAVVGGTIGGVLGAGAGGVGAVPGAIGGAGAGSSAATMAVDAYYWVSDNKQKIGNLFSRAGNKFKSIFGF